MYQSNIDWILAIAGFLAGVGVGALGYHLLNANVARNQKTRQRLAESELELSQMRGHLNDHLSRAADLVTNIQRQSQELERQLARSAEQLSDDPALKRRLGGADGEPAESDAAEVSTTPRDYADGSHGTLSEDFGLQRDDDTVRNGETPVRY
ncbi:MULTISPECIES: YhcB family protein [Modicisalibacter]|uniref:Z-ring associated protein G n=1 Tax=Modicisalibacter tunisiensis TaxID=390637 RepID=A0ABS7WZR8_9GAMM|nr:MULTISPECIES: DUF1043 family protein [Modicisalibacter]MBZ9538464.1 YhcB family protein [Modicisalibacter tunisiensis]MBZ9568123.1 YhcB family protein [Modicisalibacter tunisiensis]